MSDGSTAILVLRMLFSLVIVLATMLALVRFLQRRQVGGRRSTRRTRSVPVRVLTRTSLSRGASIQVVEIGRETLVLGVTDAGVNILADLPVDSVLGEAIDHGRMLDEPGPSASVERRLAAGVRKGRSGQTAAHAFDLLLGRAAAGQADQANTVTARLSAAPPARPGRHRG